VVPFFAEWRSGPASADRQGKNTALAPPSRLLVPQYRGLCVALKMKQCHFENDANQWTNLDSSYPEFLQRPQHLGAGMFMIPSVGYNLYQ
jgi:hypothetical protein